MNQQEFADWLGEFGADLRDAQLTDMLLHIGFMNFVMETLELDYMDLKRAIEQAHARWIDAMLRKGNPRL